MVERSTTCAITPSSSPPPCNCSRARYCSNTCGAQEGSYGGNGTSAILDHALLRPSGWPYRFQSALAFTPIFVDRPVQLSPTVSGTVRVVVDHTWIWGHATRRLEQAPVALLLGCLVALLAANLLQRQVVEPLAELAMATRTHCGALPRRVAAAAMSCAELAYELRRPREPAGRLRT